MEWVPVDGTTLEYEVTGDGEPVVFIHGALIADAFQPLVAEPALASRYQLITYHRRGYVGSSHTQRPITLTRQAEDCLGLLHHLGVSLISPSSSSVSCSPSSRTGSGLSSMRLA